MTKEISQTIIVNNKQTAANLGSGLLAVFSTPSLVAFMENTAMQLIDLPEGASSVGTSISVVHCKASAVGEQITCTATLVKQEGRKYNFELKAFDSKNELIGKGTHERFVVDIERFMSKLN